MNRNYGSRRAHADRMADSHERKIALIAGEIEAKPFIPKHARLISEGRLDEALDAASAAYWRNRNRVMVSA